MTAPKLFYRPNEFDDWGQIRNADGSMFASVRRPLSEEEAAEHRRNRTDPFEDLATRLIASFDDDEKPRYTTRRLHDEIRKAEERGRQMEREAIAAQAHVVVKPLEWFHYDSGDAHARSEITVYFAHTDGTWCHRNGNRVRAGHDLAAAKAAAQADYEARIRSALTTPAQPPVDALGQLTETQISAVMHLVETRLCIIWPKIGAREEFENALRVLEPAPDDEAEACEACGVTFEDGDMVYWRSDDSGHIHADCCGPGRESYVNADGEPLKDGEPIPQPFAWRADRG